MLLKILFIRDNRRRKKGIAEILLIFLQLVGNPSCMGSDRPLAMARCIDPDHQHCSPYTCYRMLLQVSNSINFYCLYKTTPLLDETHRWRNCWVPSSTCTQPSPPQLVEVALVSICAAHQSKVFFFPPVASLGFAEG